MKAGFLVCILLSFFLGSCDCSDKDQEARRVTLDEKEKQLLAKEDSLRLMEQELLIREKRLDSSFTDSTAQPDSSLLGNWDVKMNCTETTCQGSAVGDTKIESWNISSQGNTYLATAFTGGQVSRIYQGTIKENVLELVVQQTSAPTGEIPKIIVRVTQSGTNRLEGTREITRTDCRVLFSMEMTKKSQ